MREHDAGDLALEELFDRIGGAFLLELIQVGGLAAAEDLDAVEAELVVETAEREAGTVEVGHADLARQAGSPADTA